VALLHANGVPWGDDDLTAEREKYSGHAPFTPVHVQLSMVKLHELLDGRDI
jgi:hypothetical protein